jgi:hypothetical protein
VCSDPCRVETSLVGEDETMPCAEQGELVILSIHTHTHIISLACF